MLRAVSPINVVAADVEVDSIGTVASPTLVVASVATIHVVAHDGTHALELAKKVE